MPLPNEKPVTAVFDKGRRGNPLPGCDCVQCFGYCMVNQQIAERWLSIALPKIDNVSATDS